MGGNNGVVYCASCSTPGYLVAYIDNETIGKDVWFDHFMVGHYTSAVVAEDHYYPFGLNISIDEKAGLPPNTKKYQSIELEKHFGLQTYETPNRGLDPQIGRFNSVDQKGEKYYNATPYASMDNDPAKNVDPLGDDWATASAALILTQEAAGAFSATGVGAALVPVIEAAGIAISIWDLLDDAPTPAPAPVPHPAPAPAKPVQAAPSSNAKTSSTVTPVEKNGNGIIYKVPGAHTKSGKPYIGRHNKPTPKTRSSKDGRPRKEAEVVDTYDKSNTEEGQYKEQKAIDNHGGKENLDNKRDEVNPDRMKELEKNMEMQNKNEKNIIDFWNWFSENYYSFGSDFENEQALDLLDEKITDLGDFAWEIGPGKMKPNQLVISPGGDEDLLNETKWIVSLSPKLDDWEFYYAKQVKDWDYNFELELEDGEVTQIDASQWKYVLLRYKDGKYGIIFQTEGINKEFNEDDRVYIAQILLDSCIGEEFRIIYFDDFDLTLNIEPEYVGKEREIESLLDVFEKLIK